MISIYRGEDTDFAGQEPILVRIKTPLDLTGFTADLLFGSTVKHFESDEVGKKELKLTYSAEETSNFFPGRGFASIKVYDPEGRVAVLKRFVIDVRFRAYEDAPLTSVDVAEAIKAFECIKETASEIPELKEDDTIDVVRDALNAILDAAKKREEFSPIFNCDISKIPKNSIEAFYECIARLKALKKAADEPGGEVDYAEVVKVLNEILDAFSGRGDSRMDLEDPKSSVNSLVSWAKEINRILRIQVV